VAQGDCTNLCDSDGACVPPTNCQCITVSATGVTNLVISAPLVTRSNLTNFTLTAYVKGVLTCPAFVVTYSRGSSVSAVEPAAPCAGGQQKYQLDTSQPGVYLISARFSAGADGNVTGTASIERPSESGAARPAPEFDPLLLPLLGILALFAIRKKR
jgi:hypothetical protein